jgi:hypothetical protein
MWDYSGAKQGNPRSSETRIIDDYAFTESEPEYEPGPNAHEAMHCKRSAVAATVPPDEVTGKPSQTILCRQFFRYGTINGGPGREWTGKLVRTCDTIGTRVSRLMWTLGHFMMHEYTHYIEIVQPVLGDATVDLAYQFFANQNLDKAQTTKNADSYANFATELMWSSMCDRDFDPSHSDNKQERPPVVGSASQIVPPSVAGSSAGARASE